MEQKREELDIIREAEQDARCKTGDRAVSKEMAVSLLQAWDQGRISSNQLTRFHVDNWRVDGMLHYAIDCFPDTIALKMIQHGLGLWQSNKYNEQPIHVAAKCSSIEPLRLLLERKDAEPDMPGFHGRTPLMLAWGKKDHVELLLKAGADLFQTKIDGETAFFDQFNGVSRTWLEFLLQHMSLEKFLAATWDCKAADTIMRPKQSAIERLIYDKREEPLQSHMSLLADKLGNEALWIRAFSYKLFNVWHAQALCLFRCLPPLPEAVAKKYCYDQQWCVVEALLEKEKREQFTMEERLQACLRKLQNLGVGADNLDSSDSDFDSREECRALRDTLTLYEEEGIEYFFPDSDSDGE